MKNKLGFKTRPYGRVLKPREITEKLEKNMEVELLYFFELMHIILYYSRYALIRLGYSFLDGLVLWQFCGRRVKMKEGKEEKQKNEKH